MLRRRNRTAAVVTIAAAALLVLAGCGSGGAKGSSSTTNTASQGKPTTGGTLRLYGEGDVDHLDTASGYYDVTYTLDRAFTRQLYTYPNAADFQSQVNPVPDLATSGPELSNGNKTLTIHIRRGAMWDTNPPRQVTAADAVLGFKRLCNPVLPTGAPGYYTATIAGMKAYCNGFGKVRGTVAAIKAYIDGHNVSGLKAVDATTLQITLTQPASDFVNILALPFSSPTPVEYLNYVPDSSQFRTHTISDGPYKIDSYVANKSITLSRNPAWKASTDPIRKAYVDKIVITEGGNEQGTQQQIAAGTQDMDWDQNVPTAQLASLNASKDPRLVIGPSGDNFITINPYIAINLQSPNNGNALGKLKVRQALEYAFNKTAVSQVYGGAAISKPLNQVIPGGSVGNIPGYNPYPTPNNNGDPAKAKQLLQQAGYKPGQITLKLIYRTTTVHPQVAQTDQSALKAAGFNVKLVTVTPAQNFYTQYLENPSASKRGAWDIAEAGWIPDWLGNNGRAVIEPLFDGRTYGPNSQDYGDYNNPKVNADIDKALAASSPSEAKSAWQAAAKQVMADAAIVPIGAQKVAVFHSSRVQGCYFNFFNENCDITNVWLH
ncbi:MAG TPA: ABC transporter substrate-binding protein [Jatrophihabitantaceae bacterium]